MNAVAEETLVINVQGMTKRFGHRTVVDRIGLEVRRGEKPLQPLALVGAASSRGERGSDRIRARLTNQALVRSTLRENASRGEVLEWLNRADC